MKFNHKMIHKTSHNSEGRTDQFVSSNSYYKLYERTINCILFEYELYERTLDKNIQIQAEVTNTLTNVCKGFWKVASKILILKK